MQDWCADRLRDDCITILGQASIGCGPVLTPADVCGDALGLRGSFLREVPFPGSQPVPVAPPPARLSQGSVALARPPTLGEHSDAVLADYGFAVAEIAALRGAGTI